MAVSISASGSGLTISWSWSSSELFKTWSVSISGIGNVDQGTSATSDSGSYTVASYGTYTVSIGGRTMADVSMSASSLPVTLVDPTVTCTKNVYYDGSFSTSETESGLTPGYTFTPEAHMPSYDSTHYRFVSCSPSGAMTCPNEDFSVSYYFVSTVSCDIIANYSGSQGEEVVETITCTIGSSINANSYIPTVQEKYRYMDSFVTNGTKSGNIVTVPNRTDFYIRYFFQIRSKVALTIIANKNGTTETIDTYYVYEGTELVVANYQPIIEDYEYTGEWTTTASTYTTTTVIVPSSAFSITYKFKPISIVYIYATKDGVTDWYPAIPYIYANNQWNPATAYIYANGHWNPQ